MPELPREGNAWFTLMGLDIMPDISAYEAGLQKFDIMRGQTPHAPVPPTLTFQGDIEQFSCWYNGNPEAAGCPDAAALDKLLTENYDLLIRLEEIGTSPVLMQPWGTGDAVSNVLIESLFHLKMAEVVLLIKQDRAKDAMEIWVNGWHVLRAMSLGRVDLHWRGLFAGLMHQWSGLFPVVLAGKPEQLERSPRRLYFLLRPLDVDAMDFDARLKHAGRLLIGNALDESGLSGAERDALERRLKNIFYRHATITRKALALPSVAEAYDALLAARLEEEQEDLASEYSIGPGQVLKAAEVFHQGELDTLFRMVQADLANNEYSRMFIQDLDSTVNKVPAFQMQSYLDVQDDFMQCQITGKPFVWDPERQDIHFIAPDNLERRLHIQRFGGDDADADADAGEGEENDAAADRK